MKEATVRTSLAEEPYPRFGRFVFRGNEWISELHFGITLRGAVSKTH